MGEILVTRRQFADKVGCSAATITNLVHDGVLPNRPDKKLPLAAALDAFNKYARTKSKGRSQKLRQVSPVNEKQIMKAAEAASGDGEGNVNLALTKAKLAEKTYQARLKELDYKSRTGALLDRDEVEAEAAALAEKVKAKLLAIPPRISSMCEGRIARDIEEIITDAINDALRDLQSLKRGD